MAKCWEQRGCDEEMQAECPHSAQIGDRCPTKCAFAACQRPTYDLVTDPELLWDVSVDRSHAIKEPCLFCRHYLTRGPRVPE